MGPPQILWDPLGPREGIKVRVQRESYSNHYSEQLSCWTLTIPSAHPNVREIRHGDLPGVSENLIVYNKLIAGRYPITETDFDIAGSWRKSVKTETSLAISRSFCAKHKLQFSELNSLRKAVERKRSKTEIHLALSKSSSSASSVAWKGARPQREVQNWDPSGLQQESLPLPSREGAFMAKKGCYAHDLAAHYMWH